LVRAAAGIDSIEMSGDFSENDNWILGLHRRGIHYFPERL
jgi:hypothetical protein